MVFDVPYSVTVCTQTLSAVARDHIWKNLQPGRCMQLGLVRVLRGLGMMDGGGNILFRQWRPPGLENHVLLLGGAGLEV